MEVRRMYKQLIGFTLTGMYNYFQIKESPLFNNITLFEGGTVYNNEWEDGQVIPPIDKQVMIDYIMEEGCDLYTKRVNPDRFKTMCENFFKAQYNNFRMIWIALNMNYNPIDNYDRHEYILDEYNSSTKRTDSTHYRDTNDLELKGKEKTVETPKGFETVTNTITGKQITTNKVSAMNDIDYAPHDYSEVEFPVNETKTEYDNTRKNETEIEYGSSNSKRENNGTFEHIYLDGNDLNEHLGDDTRKIWSHGNIGIEKTSSIIKAELELRQFNFYTYVARTFTNELLLEVY